MPLRVAAISFLNPAPLLYDFEHAPQAGRLCEHYSLHYTSPADCARELLSGEADVGLVPIAALNPELAVVPGCTIASLYAVRSILLMVKAPGHLPVPDALAHVRTIATDAASRSSTAYARLLLERFYGVRPAFEEQAADPLAMLAQADAALLIGDPALIAREHKANVDAASTVPLHWLDLATLWREHTGLPWVAAVWAVRPEAIAPAGLTSSQLNSDLNRSRDNGLAHVEELVREWTPRLPLHAETIREYLTRNIHYRLDPACLEAILLFRKLAAGIGALPPLPHLNLLG